MIVSSTRNARRGELAAALVAFAVTAAAWQTLSRAAAYLIVEDGWPSIAISMRPSDGHALSRLAFLAIDRRHPPGSVSFDVKSIETSTIKKLAQQSLETMPLNSSVLRLLSQLAGVSHQRASSERITEIAGRQTIRDAVLDLDLLRLYVARKDYAGALERADALLRIAPELTPSTLSIIGTIAVDQAARPALVKSLQAGPPWRASFLTDIASKIVSPEDFLDVVLALKDGDRPLDDSELRAYLDPLIARDLIDEAYGTWLQTLPSERLGDLRYLDNGDFEQPLSNLPFDWMIKPIDGATIAVEEGPGLDGHALHVQFDGRRTPFRNVSQLLELPAGRYLFSGSYRSVALDNQRGMTWRIYCAQRSDSTPLAQTDRVSGTSDGWKTFETAFEVPADHCTAQWLRLELAARLKIEESVAGGIWYDRLEIGRRRSNDMGSNVRRITIPDQPGTAFERAVRGR